MLLLPQTSKDNALNVARRLHKMIRENSWLASEGLNIKVTTSLGVASYPVDSRSKEGLLHLADEAMYLVKNTTRDNVAAANVGVLPIPWRRLNSLSNSNFPDLQGVHGNSASYTHLESLFNLMI